jgi:peptidoglycan hydrolase-like protein with peptidoglycan-binding domain
MRLRHILIAATAFVSLGALAEGNRAAPDKQAQTGTAASVQSQANSSVIKQVQQKLSTAGHDAGRADGVLGARTQQALKDFQQAKGIEATGQLDQRTLSALGVSAGVGATPSSAPEASVGSPAKQSSGDAGSAKRY